LRGDLVRLDDERLKQQRQAERERDDDDQLDEAAGGALRLWDARFQAWSLSESSDCSPSPSSLSEPSAGLSVSLDSGSSVSNVSEPDPAASLPASDSASACASGASAAPSS
jgi:hypothetical protein